MWAKREEAGKFHELAPVQELEVVTMQSFVERLVEELRGTWQIRAYSGKAQEWLEMSELPRRVVVESDLSQSPNETDRLRALRRQTQAPRTGEIEQVQIAAPGPRYPAKMLDAHPVMTSLTLLPIWRHLGSLYVKAPRHQDFDRETSRNKLRYH